MKEETKKIYTPEEKHLTCDKCGLTLKVFQDTPIKVEEYGSCHVCGGTMKQKKVS